MENATFWGEALTFLGTVTGLSIIAFKIKGRQDERMSNVESDIKKQEKRVDGRVHINEFNNLKETMDREFSHVGAEFSHVRETLKRIEGKLP